MDRKRNLAMIAGTVAVALGAGQYLQSGSAESAASMTPVPSIETPPSLRQAAATPLDSHEPAPLPVALEADPPPPRLRPLRSRPPVRSRSTSSPATTPPSRSA